MGSRIHSWIYSFRSSLGVAFILVLSLLSSVCVIDHEFEEDSEKRDEQKKETDTSNIDSWKDSELVLNGLPSLL